MENILIANERISAGSRTYFIDLKVASDNRKYISINEKKTSKEGKVEYSKVLLFEDNFFGFLNSFIKIIDEAGPLPKPSLEKIKEQYPNAYSPWTPEDDQKLDVLFTKGKTVEELTVIFKRQPGAIEARLNKLGLNLKAA